MYFSEIAKIFSSYRDNNVYDIDRRNDVLDALVKKRNYTYLINNTAFVQIPFPKAVNYAFDLHEELTQETVGSYQEITVDILLFRVSNADPFRKYRISINEFKELDALVAAFSPLHTPDIATIKSVKQLKRIQKYCYSTSIFSNPFCKHVFNFDLDMYYEMIEADEDTIEFIKRDFDKRNTVVKKSIKEFSNANYFKEREEVFVHYLDDSSDEHGCIRMPWKISIGKDYVFVELRHGIWY